MKQLSAEFRFMFSYSTFVDQTRNIYLVENLSLPLKMKNLINYPISIKGGEIKKNMLVPQILMKRKL